MQENGSDFTLSKPTEGVKLSGAAAGGATVNGSTLWRHPLGGGRRCNVRIGSSRSAVTMNISWHRLLPYESLRQQDGEDIGQIFLR